LQARLEELMMSNDFDYTQEGSGGGIAWDKNDIYAQVIGKDKHGYVRGLGFGPTPSMKDTSVCHGCKMSSKVDTIQCQEAMRQMSQQIKTLEAQIAKLVSNFNQNQVAPEDSFATTL